MNIANILVKDAIAGIQTYVQLSSSSLSSGPYPRNSLRACIYQVLNRSHRLHLYKVVNTSLYKLPRSADKSNLLMLASESV